MPTTCGTITVREPFSAGNLVTETCEITSSGPYNPGDSVQVQVGVRNDNPVQGTANVVVRAGGSEIAAGQITVGQNASESVTLGGPVPQPSGDAESFEVITEVSTASRGSAGVPDPGDPTPSPGPGRDPGGDPGGGPPRVPDPDPPRRGPSPGPSPGGPGVVSPLDGRRDSGSGSASEFGGVY